MTEFLVRKYNTVFFAASILVVLILGALFANGAEPGEAASQKINDIKCPDIPKTVEKLPEMVDRMNLLAQVAITKDFAGLQNHPLIKGPTTRPGVAPTVEIKVTFKGGRLATILADCDKKNCFQADYLPDGSIIRYLEGQLDWSTVTLLETGGKGHLIGLTSLTKGGSLLGPQIIWDADGHITKEEELTTPQPFVIRKQ